MRSSKVKMRVKELPAEVPVLGAADFIKYELVRYKSHGNQPTPAGVCRRCVIGHIAHTFCGISDDRLDRLDGPSSVTEEDVVGLTPKPVLDAFVATMPPIANKLFAKIKDDRLALGHTCPEAVMVDLLESTNDNRNVTLRQLAMWWNRAMKYLEYTEAV